ncbi:MAG: NAD(P)/FAD-dependent oxidoreductase [Pirellulaceae bacterium]|nr:NAD(P)/FAD-dependent oxidoreductase [Pirellulaceae bacterium]
MIIGAGMSGLAAGVRIAHFGKKVCILERHGAIGGLNSFYKQRGRTFDVGLHAVTNYAAKGSRSGPLVKLLRQLRLAWDEWALAPQIGSVIMFPSANLRFSNDFELLETEVRCRFPRQVDNFRRLVASLHDYDQFGQSGAGRSARQVVSDIIDDPLLVEMIFCPVLFYGGSREHDIDFDQFSILFRSIFLEGLARPLAGIQRILTMLARRFKEQGGELRLKAGVSRIVVYADRVQKVVLEDGAELEAKNVLSSAGYDETMRLCDNAKAEETPAPNRISVVESISILDAQPRALGHEQTIIFFNDSDKFRYEQPDDLVDLRSGTICSPNNFAYPEPMEEGMLRITALANYDRWAALDADAYRRAKEQWSDRLIESAARFVPDFRGSVIGGDMFTPLTISRFTGHSGGAVYGSAEKRRDGTSHLKNLFICGNDQGLVGIVGAIISGISIANRYLLE